MYDVAIRSGRDPAGNPSTMSVEAESRWLLPDDVPPRPVAARMLRLPPLIGRREELSRINHALERAALGHGSLWSITGAAGIGKTRLMTEIARMADRRGFDVRWSFSTWEGQAPLSPFRRMMEARRPATGASVGATTEKRPLPQGSRSDFRRGLRGAGQNRTPEQTSLELLDAIDEAARLAPLLLLVDDFHRSDADSIRFLKLLAGMMTSRRLLVVFSFREESPVIPGLARPGLASLVEELRIAGSLRPLELSGLTEGEMTRLAESLVPSRRGGRNPDPLRVAALVKVAGGNPFFLRELLSFSLETGSSWARPASAPVGSAPTVEAANADPGHGPVEDLLRHRLRDLPRQHRRMLGVAALIGDTFSMQEVAAALPAPERYVYEALGKMGALGWPVRRRPGRNEQLTFGHSLLRQACDELLLPSERRRLAGRLARWWVRNRSEDLESIGRLCAESGTERPGRSVVDRLIEEAIQSHAFASIERYLVWRSRIVGSTVRARREHLAYLFSVLDRMRPNEPLELGRLCQRFLDLHPPEPRRSIVEAWGVACKAFDDPRNAPALLDRLRHRIESDGRLRSSRSVRVQLELSQLRVLAGEGAWGQVFSTAQSLERLVRSRGPSFELLVATQQLALSLHRLGRIPEALEWLRRAREVCRKAALEGTTTGLGLRTIHASMEYSADHGAKAAEIEEAVARQYFELGSFRRAVAAWNNVGAARLAVGDPAGARRAYLEALALVRRAGLEPQEGQCYTLLGLGLLEEGRIPEAARYLRRALLLVKKSTHPDDYTAMARIGLARVALAQGKPGESDHELRLAEELCAHPNFPLRPDVERTRAQWLAQTGNVEAARALLRRSLARSSPSMSPIVRRETLTVLAGLGRETGGPPRTGAAETSEREPSVPEDTGRRTGPPARATLGSARGRTSRPAGDSSLETQLEVMGRVSDRLLRALYRADAIADGALDREVVPLSFTQAGLASDLGLPQSSFARALLRLVGRGAILPSRRRVEGASRSLKAYLLTSKGLEMARGLAA